ncbi:MAG TPA: hypothetical protein VHJ20_14815 [Polyangia bacterium]|nr:hypothetical protein [Polyangia bacterium]
MKRGGILVVAAVALGAATFVGCGSSGSSSPDGGGGVGGATGGTGGRAGAGGTGGGTCHSNSTVGAFASWAEDGAPKCAYLVNAYRATDANHESLQLQATTLGGASVAFAVVATGTSLTGTFPCSTASDGGALIGTPGTVYVDFVHTGTKQSCSVTITNPGVIGGAHASGSFSATFTGAMGAVVTNGLFDTNVLATPGND